MLVAGVPAQAQVNDDRLRLTGAYELYGGLRLSAEPDFLSARNRAELLLDYGYDRGRIVLRSRLEYDALAEAFRADLREAFAEVFFARADVRIGHQLIAWGRTDGAFITDLLAPLDLSEFLARPPDDLRLGVTALQATVFLGDAELTGIAVPHRPTSRLPETGSPWFPAPRTVFGVPVVRVEPPPAEPTLGASETALRLVWRGLPRTDVAAVWVNGFNRLPALRKGLGLTPGVPPVARITLTPAYERRQVLGLSGETLALDPFVLRAEAAYHSAYLLDQRIEIPATLAELQDPALQDAIARGFLLRKPFAEVSLGVERSIGAHLVGVQGLGRWVLDYDERVAADRFEHTLTLLWLGRFLRDTATARVFALYNPGRDYWLNPEATYAVQDGLNVSLGLQVFGGRGPAEGDLVGILREPTFRFSAFDGNDFAYLRVVYGF